MLNVSIKFKTTASKNNCADCSKRLPNGCAEPSASYLVPAGNSIVVSASSPIFESGFVVTNATRAPSPLAFSANKRKCSVLPEPEITINKSPS